MHQERVKEIISSFKKALENNGVKAEKIILFGSHAKGTADENSDIDLVVISRDFARMGFKHRCEVLGRVIAEVMEPIEPLAYTPEEFESLPGFNVFTMAKNAGSYIVV